MKYLTPDQLSTIKAALENWLVFAADVQPHDAAGTDWLDICRGKTIQALAILSALTPKPGKWSPPRYKRRGTRGSG